MPDFDIRITTVAFRPKWVDTPTAAAPSRINPIAGINHSYWRIDPPATVRFEAVVGGVTGPADATLGGRLFTSSWAEWPPGVGPPILTPVAASSSKVDAAFQSFHLGHYVFAMRREGGGCILFHIDSEE